MEIDTSEQDKTYITDLSYDFIDLIEKYDPESLEVFIGCIIALSAKLFLDCGYSQEEFLEVNNYVIQETFNQRKKGK